MSKEEVENLLIGEETEGYEYLFTENNYKENYDVYINKL